MSELWTYNRTVGTPDRDLEGFDAEGTDGHIGRVSASATHGELAYLVIDIGRVRHKSRVVPARTVRQIDLAGEKVFLSMDKHQVEKGPDDDALRLGEREVREAIAAYYTPHV
ncbi:MAG: hypothetical protein S0880_29760 [Actinomycetota bacterium]|nr:hypothetical protein [Actinomycetota bacterium]